ncbi:hypothetical protein V8B97DRAFT_2011770 [Scleroderma yunnanense]
MTNNQSKIRYSKSRPWKTKPVQVTTDSQFALSQKSSTALVPNIPSASHALSNTAKGKLANIKSLLRPNWSNQSIASASIRVERAKRFPYILRLLAELSSTKQSQELASNADEPVAPVIAVRDKMDAAQNEVGTMAVIPPVGQHAVGLFGAINTTVPQIDTINSTYFRPLKRFTTVASTISDIHPSAQIALGILTSAARLIIAQANLDEYVSNLLEKIQIIYLFLLEEDILFGLHRMQDTLVPIAKAISNCAQFIINYSETQNFWKRLGKNIESEMRTVVDEYNRVLDDLMQQYRSRAVRDTHINVYRVLEDLNLDGMAYARGAGLNTTKQCLDGTRMEILKEIVDWIHDPDVNAPRIFWLHGQAGRGKSAIAHTIALKIERREEKMLPTIARDLANRDPAFRRALAKAIEEDNTLKITPDVMQQWEKLLLRPLSKVSGGITGNVVIVIDALDESGMHILSVLASTKAARLPSNFRILFTSRLLPDIIRALRDAQHVKATSLDNIPTALAERDIRLYVSNMLRGLEDIGEREIEYITLKADGLFEWARLACDFIKLGFAGETAKERFGDLTARTSGKRETLMDSMYGVILHSAASGRSTSLVRFRSLMRQILQTSEPLSMDALHAMRKCFPHEEDSYNVAIVLNYMSPLLSGITDHTQPIRPLHDSFYDFLTDQSRSGDYFIGDLLEGVVYDTHQFVRDIRDRTGDTEDLLHQEESADAERRLNETEAEGAIYTKLQMILQ